MPYYQSEGKKNFKKANSDGFAREETVDIFLVTFDKIELNHLSFIRRGNR